MTEERAKALVQLHAGIIPEQVEYTNMWAITSSDWEANGPDALSAVYNEAFDFMTTTLPQRFNWVRLDVVWL